jgi:hypothetical protein
MIIHFNPLASEEAGLCWFKDNGKTNIKEKVFGMSGLLDFLELYTGNKTDGASEQLRLVKARESLKEFILPEHIFYESFNANEFSFASESLKLLDHLTLLEWNGTFNEDTPRMELLSVLKEDLKNYPSQSDRWVNLKNYLNAEGFPKNVISKLIIYGNKETIHPFFKSWPEEVFKDRVSYCVSELMPGDNNLRRIAKAFKNKTFEIGTLSGLENDSSIIVIHAGSSRTLADLQKDFIYGSVLDCTLINSTSGTTIDGAFTQGNYPSMAASIGATNTSIGILHFHLLNLLYEVPDTYEIIRFLSSKFCPVNQEVRRMLKKLLIKKPGYDFDYYLTVLSEKVDLTELSEKSKLDLKKLIASEINDWFINITKSTEKGEKIFFKVQDIFNFFQMAIKTYNTNANDLKTADVNLAVGFLSSVNQVLQSLNIDEISETELFILFENFLSRSKPVMLVPEAGSMPMISSPASLIEGNKVVLWWCPSASDASIAEMPLFFEEKNMLQENSLWNNSFQENTINAWFEATSRVFINSWQSLVIYIADKSEGEDLRSHPFMDFLAAAVSNLQDITVELDHGINEAIKKLTSTGLFHNRISEVPKANLPLMKDAWQLNWDNVTLNFPEKESFSSLEKLVYYPNEYVLDKLAQITSVNFPDPNEEMLNYGNLCHSIFEQFFKTLKDKNISDKEVELNIITLFNKQVRIEYGFLNRPQNKLKRDYLAKTIKMSAFVLMKHIRKSPFTIFEPERKIGFDEDIVFGSTKLKGNIDLVLSNEKGEKAIIDLKWAGKTKRISMLKDDNDLQLPIYSYLLSPTVLVPTSYFVINKAILISYPNKYFPDAFNVNVPASPNTINEKLKKAYSFRREEIERGYLEVGIGTAFSKLGENSNLWNETGGIDFPRPYKTKDKKKPANTYSIYTNLNGSNLNASEDE